MRKGDSLLGNPPPALSRRKPAEQRQVRTLASFISLANAHSKCAIETN
jgi:hypothetical protein